MLLIIDDSNSRINIADELDSLDVGICLAEHERLEVVVELGADVLRRGRGAGAQNHLDVLNDEHSAIHTVLLLANLDNELR